MAAAEKKLDIFWLLGQVDRKNYDLWSQLTEEQRKEFTAYVATMWMAGTDEFEQLTNLGDIAAPCVFDFGKKPELMLKVLTACSVGGPKRYEWCAPKATKKHKLAVELIASVYHMPLRHAAEMLPMFTPDELEELARVSGWQPDELKELKKSL
jgi:hypothetical protein